MIVFHNQNNQLRCFSPVIDDVYNPENMSFTKLRGHWLFSFLFETELFYILSHSPHFNTLLKVKDSQEK